ncbi:putative AAA domain containing protein [Rhypophila sp. PSN 637]
MVRDLLDCVRNLEAQLGVSHSDDFGKKSRRSSIVIQEFHCLEDFENATKNNAGHSGRHAKPLMYLGSPAWEVYDGEVKLKGQFPVYDSDTYIKKRGDITFAAYKIYSPEHQTDQVERAIRANESLPPPEPLRQRIVIVSEEMTAAIRAFSALEPTFRDEFTEFNGDDTYHGEDDTEGRNVLESPFIWWYHYRKSNKIQELPAREIKLVTAITSWIEANYGALYANVDDQLLCGRVSKDSMQYLIRPGQVVILQDKDLPTPTGHVALGRPSRWDTKSQKRDDSYDEPLSQWRCCWTIRVRSYIYAGDFYRKEDTVTFGLSADAEEEEVEITSLRLVPLNFAPEEVSRMLETRGKTFWSCRNKRLVSYDGNKTQMGQRFMLDFGTYTELHPANKYIQETPYRNVTMDTILDWKHDTTIGPTIPGTEDDAEPTAPEIYLFPTHLPGFDLRRRKWVDLRVDHIKDVAWNEQAFHSLVADEDMKELILALVTNQLSSEAATDLIDSKGNGLVMLLHGSPGTGKTFTAESVAEIAKKKPLYSVTCGDIGTEPEAVEKYLTSVFHLGKVWDCVVLLDEAEVFLEQRTLQDLKRNALVSVFLRALEYNEGILILTTNRVGTFDEAFKSRIQLALRYEKLRTDQRKQIWRNFMERLKTLAEEERNSIDFSNVTLHLNELAAQEMNGREITNSITTARQLAKYMKEKMTFSHLQRAIGMAQKFDRYLAEVREADVDGAGGRGPDGRYPDEYFARVDQMR